MSPVLSTWQLGTGAGFLLLVAAALAAVILLNRRFRRAVARHTAALEARCSADLQAEVEARRRVEALLRQRETMLNRAQKLAALGSFCWDLRTDSLTWSENLLASAGPSPDTPAGTLSEISRQVIHPEDRAAVAEQIASMVASRQMQPLEFRILRPDGKIRFLRSDSEFILDKNGEPLSCAGLYYDLTESREIEAALKESQRFSAAVLQVVPTHLYIYDLREERNTWVNVAHGRFLMSVGADYEAPRGLDPFFHPDDRPAVAARLDRLRTRQDGRWEAVEFRFRTPGGGWAWMLDRAVVFERDADGNVCQILGAAVDISAQKMDQKQLRTAVAERETRLRELYHRTRNNMQVISAMLRLHGTRLADPQAQTALADTEQRIQAMALVHEKLYWSQNLAVISLPEYVRELVNLLLASSQLEPEQVAVRLEIDEVGLPVDSAVPCGLILTELVTNSLKHAFPDGRRGEIAIRCRHGAERVEVKVADNGIGLPAGFDFRATDTLGLPTVIAIVEHQLGGRVRFESHDGLTCFIEFDKDHFALPPQEEP